MNKIIFSNVDKKLKKQETRWCYSCNETKPLTSELFAYTDKTHTKFRNKCRKCTNWDSMISHRIHRKLKSDKNEDEINI